MCALYSIKDGHNPKAAEVIHSVFMEEMLHLTLAAKLLNAVGGRPRLDMPALLPAHPSTLPHSDGSVVIALQPLSPAAVDAFLAIERPGEASGEPEDDRFETIGQFYAAIGQALVTLAAEIGEEALFSGDPARQVTGTAYYGGAGGIIAVTDLASARRALEEIVEQGEGLDHGSIWDGERSMFHPDRDEVGHYFRFLELREGRRHAPEDTPRSGPTGEPLDVDWDAVHPMRPNPRRAEHTAGSHARIALDAFARDYCCVLHLLEHTFDGSPALLAVATGAMYALKAQAVSLMQTPHDDGSGQTLGPAFEWVLPEERHHARHDSSASKPFCDGTHARFGFDGTETADPSPSATHRRTLEGEGFVVRRDGPLCMHAAFCVGREERIPAMMARTGDSDVRAHVMALIERCPSGSYTFALDDSSADVEPHLPIAIGVTEEEKGLAGALWVTGGVPIERADGQRCETRNRVTLRRCGQSENKPFSTGHAARSASANSHEPNGPTRWQPAEQSPRPIVVLRLVAEQPTGPLRRPRDPSGAKRPARRRDPNRREAGIHAPTRRLLQCGADSRGRRPSRCRTGPWPSGAGCRPLPLSGRGACRVGAPTASGPGSREDRRARQTRVARGTAAD
jgi:CDGSH-type Zn-finger protein